MIIDVFFQSDLYSFPEVRDDEHCEFVRLFYQTASAQIVSPGLREFKRPIWEIMALAPWLTATNQPQLWFPERLGRLPDFHFYLREVYHDAKTGSMCWY